MTFTEFKAEYSALPFDLNRPNVQDSYLLHRLGMRWDLGRTWEWVGIGRAEMRFPGSDGHAVVEIEYFAVPATHWRIHITDAEGGQHLVTTASGSLSEYWPTVELIARGYITVVSGDV